MAVADIFGWEGAVVDGLFEVRESIEEGGFGIVYYGHHLSLNVPIAIKCLKFPAGVDPGSRGHFLRRFEREAQLLHRLSSLTATIVKVLHFGSATSPTNQLTPYMVMEWLDGETLAANLHNRYAAGQPPRTLTETIALLSPAATALSIAHDEKVTHRDIKPSNIFLTNLRSGIGLKVLDFGIAGLGEWTHAAGPVDPTEDTHTLTLPAHTPQYSAPEQFHLETADTGPWTDVFAFALCFIEVVSGQRVLSGDNLLQLYQSSKSAQSRIPRTLPPDVTTVLQRALAPNPKDRYTHMRLFWEGLRAVTKSHTLAAAAPEGPLPPEYRVCSVMFVDLSGLTHQLSDSLPEEYDLEEAEETISRYVRSLSEEIERAQGTVTKRTGDTVMAVFGAMRALETDAERATAAAVRIRSSLTHAQQPDSLDSSLPVRIGIHTGSVLVRRKSSQELVVTGQVVNEAAQLQQAAAWGEILVGHSTQRRVFGRYNLGSARNVQPAGRKAPLAAYPVTSSIAYPRTWKPSAFYGVETRLIGRKTVLHQLIDTVEDVLEEKHAAMVTIVGGAGSGRTRLLYELLQHVQQRDETFLLMTAHGSAMTVGVSHRLTSSIIRGRFDIGEYNEPNVIAHKLWRGMKLLQLRARKQHRKQSKPLRNAKKPTWERSQLKTVLDEIVILLNTSGAATNPHYEMAPDDDAGGRMKHRIVAACLQLLEYASAEMPILLLCDDIQWADDASLDLLAELVARLHDSKVMIVCTARPNLYERRPNWGEGEDRHQRITLGALKMRHVEEMVRDRLGRVADLPEKFVQQIARRAEGNPLLLDETLHLLVDTGIIETMGSGAWRVHEDRLGTIALPTTIHQLIQARLDRLEQEEQDCLLRASVIGRRFWHTPLDRLRKEGSRALRTSTDTLIERLRARQFIQQREVSIFAGEQECIFTESSTQEAIYATLTKRFRRPLHQLVAEWLTERGRKQVDTTLLAYHYERGGDVRRAAAAYADAGTTAIRMGENDEALQHLEHAVALFDSVDSEEVTTAARVSPGPANSEAVRSHTTTPGQATADILQEPATSWRALTHVYLELGDVYRRLGRLEAAENSYQTARTRIRRNSDDIEADAITTKQQIIRWDARVDYRLALLSKVRGQLEESRKLLERAIERATAGDAVEETPRMLALLAVLHRRERHPEQSLKIARRALGVLRAARLRKLLDNWAQARIQNDIAWMLCGLGAALSTCGKLVASQRSYQQALRVIDEGKSPHLAGIALNGVAVAQLQLGHASHAHTNFRRSLELKERIGDLHQLAIAYSNVAWRHLSLAQFSVALDYARHAVKLGEHVGARSDLPAIYNNLAEALAGTGKMTEALDASLKAVETATAASQVYLGPTSEQLATICVQASTELDNPNLLAKAHDALAFLRSTMKTHFREGELLQTAVRINGQLDAANM